MENKIKKIRLDVYLTNNDYFETREKARVAIMEGKVFVNNQKEDKPGTMIKEDAQVEFRGEKLKYVSRGGYKLEKAVNVFDIKLEDKVCIDIGASTGGFTDVMLQNGAKKVYAIDCGTNQLDYRLRTDDRVVPMENTNARYLTKENIDNSLIDFVTVDVSFISLDKIIGVVYEVLKENGDAVLLIKPQFEAGKELVEKGGVVRSKKTHISVIKKVIETCKNNNFAIMGLDYSPIKGPAGNIEYLIHIVKNGTLKEIINTDDEFVEKMVDNAHREL